MNIKIVSIEVEDAKSFSRVSISSHMHLGESPDWICWKANKMKWWVKDKTKIKGYSYMQFIIYYMYIGNFSCE